MATSEARIAANRRNAQKSTGPKTEAGKTVSRHNALKHGCAAAVVTLPHENADEFDAMHARLVTDHKPATEAERILVAEIAQASLMLQRSARYEAALFDVQIGQLKHEKGRSLEPAANDDMAIAINFCLPRNHQGLSNMFRYMARAEAKLHRAIDRLRALQNDRLRREGEAEKPAQPAESNSQWVRSANAPPLPAPRPPRPGTERPLPPSPSSAARYGTTRVSGCRKSRPPSPQSRPESAMPSPRSAAECA